MVVQYTHFGFNIMADDVQQSYDYTELLTEIIKGMPKQVSLNIIQKRVKEKLSKIEPDSCRSYLESALLENISTFFFETDDDGNITTPKEAAVMSNMEKNTHKDLLLAAAISVDEGDLDTARFLLQAADDLVDDEEITEYEEEINNAPYQRLQIIEDKGMDLGLVSLGWVRITVDKANRDPNWVKYCRLHRALHIGPLTWDFPIFPYENVLDVLRTIREETGYSPRWYEQLDRRIDGTKDLPATPFVASTDTE